jgi:PAS domain S-box-containing protein
MLLASDFPMCSVWGKHRIQIYNDAYNVILGDKHPAAFGAPARESWHEIWEFLGPALDQVMAGKTLWFSRALLPLIRKLSPEECYFDFSYSPIRNADGVVTGALSVAAERTSEVVQQRRESLWQLDARIAGDTIFEGLALSLHDILEANGMDCEGAALFSAADDARAPDSTVWKLRADEGFVRQVRPLAAQALHNRGISSGISSASTKNARATGIPFFGRDGSPCCALVIVPSVLVPYEASFLPFAEAVSERVHAVLHAAERSQREVGEMRQRILEQDQVYQFLFENIQDGIAYCSIDGAAGDEEIILAVNPCFCKMSGYDASEVIGMDLEEFLFPRNGVSQADLELRKREFGFRGELDLRTKEGNRIPVEISSNLVEFETRKTRSVTLIRDMSYQIQAENERVRKVRVETIANLAGALAHDTNNLMTIVIGSAELLAENLPKGGREHKLAMNAIVAAERACGLTNQLLTYSRGTRVVARPIDLNEFLEEIKPLVTSALGDIFELIIKREQALPQCLSDPTQLTTAILNLTTNARHAMPHGGTLEIETFCIPAAVHRKGAKVEFVGLRVTDTGVGIPHEIQERIFDPFFTTKGAGIGSGLGLSIVKRFVEDLGGTVHMRSILGQGTAFELCFPSIDPAGADDAREDNGHWTIGDIVLYVEDNETVRHQTETLLQQIGAEPVTFTNARNALDWLRLGGKPAILFTDLVLPGGMSGRELAVAARRILPSLPVLITTGYDEGVLLPHNQAIAILHKPYTRRSLEAAMMQQIRSS